jgi:hypothetical protein
MLDGVNHLMLREQPWYLSGEPITLQHCPCGCGAIVVAIQHEISVMRWPTTNIGDTVRRLARKQAEALFEPYLDALKNEPRKQLPVDLDNSMSLSGDVGSHELLLQTV